MRKEFIVERQGRSFCLYAGLLDVAHQQGLKSIRTELVQIPSEANNRVAICSATVVLEQDGIEREFTGLGDAAPNNVTPAMQTCLLRMAETRAKARALRDAVNIGVAAFEELGEDDEFGSGDRPNFGGQGRNSRPDRSPAQNRSSGGPVRSGQALNRLPADAASAAAPGPESRAEATQPANGEATEKQLEAIRNLCRRQSVDAELLATETCGVESLAALTHAQAGEMIRELNGRYAARPASGQ